VPPCSAPRCAGEPIAKPVTVRGALELTPITAANRSVARRRAREAQPFRAGYVGRPVLVGRLLDARDTKLVLIVAPAGYGKSTLLAEWAHRDARPFIPIRFDSG